MDIKKLIREEFDNILNEANKYIDLRVRNALQGLYIVSNLKYDPYEHDRINGKRREKNKERRKAGKEEKPEKQTYAEKTIQRALAFLYKFAYTSQNPQMVFMYYDLYRAFYNIRLDQNAFFEKVRLCYQALYAYYDDIRSGSIDNESKYAEIYDGGNGDFMNSFNNWMSGAKTQQQSSGKTEETGETSGQTETPQEAVDTPEKQEEVQELAQDVSSSDYNSVNIDFFGTDWFGFGQASENNQNAQQG